MPAVGRRLVGLLLAVSSALLVLSCTSSEEPSTETDVPQPTVTRPSLPPPLTGAPGQGSTTSPSPSPSLDNGESPDEGGAENQDQENPEGR
ncbi:MAG TPA: hypothetical protein VIL00_03700 [Pseudonocardiaceae bacterium]